MTGMRSWISATSSFESVVMMANVRIHSPEAGSFQFSQMPAMPNGAPSFIAHRVGLLCLLALDRLPLKESVHRHNAAALAVCVAERRQIPARSRTWSAFGRRSDHCTNKGSGPTGAAAPEHDPSR